MVNPRKKPKFLKQGAKYLKKVKKKWRRPRGTHSKLKVKEKSKGAIPKVGYRAPKSLRGLHPSGFKEVLIQNLGDLEGIDKEKEAGRISRTMGKKKRKLIIERAKELKIKILNP
jgi:large subunit ribosomal protein L32e